MQHILDIFVQQKLATEVIQLLSNELVKLSDDTLQDANTVRSNRVQHLVDTNGANLFGFARFLHENLLVKIVVVVSHKALSFSQKLHDIDSLLQLLIGQVRIANLYAQLVLS